ncbi:hypothetical protein ACFO3D_04925 [Virgibacillus kekensis]|uniref:Uncharacterized protein n=1 Tax=Virgibacillus kekensis TaxID=202261 RepID=A0ABV9DFF4_9BACI
MMENNDYYEVERMINEGLAGGFLDGRYGTAQYDLPEQPGNSEVKE